MTGVKKIVGICPENKNDLYVETTAGEFEVVSVNVVKRDLGEDKYNLLMTTFSHIEDIAKIFWEMADDKEEEGDPFLDFLDLKESGYCILSDFGAVMDCAISGGWNYLAEFLQQTGFDGFRFLTNNFKLFKSEWE